MLRSKLPREPELVVRYPIPDLIHKSCTRFKAILLTSESKLIEIGNRKLNIVVLDEFGNGHWD